MRVCIQICIFIPSTQTHSHIDNLKPRASRWATRFDMHDRDPLFTLSSYKRNPRHV